MGIKVYRPSIEINITEHCNLRCVACDHSSPLMEEKFADEAEIQRDLSVLSSALYAHQLQILGGEPLLHPGLVRILEVAKDARIANQLVLLTNGTLLHRMPAEAWALLDGVLISRYPSVKLTIAREELEARARENDIWIRFIEMNEFAWKALNTPLEIPRLIREVYLSCLDVHLFSCSTIHEGRFYKCEPSVFVSKRLSVLGISFDNREVDSVAIHNNERLAEDLHEFLCSEQPLRACRYCLGSLGKVVPHKMRSPQDLLDEIREFGSSPYRELMVENVILPSCVPDHRRGPAQR